MLRTFSPQAPKNLVYCFLMIYIHVLWHTLYLRLILVIILACFILRLILVIT